MANGMVLLVLLVWYGILYHNTILYDTRYNTVVVVCCGGKKLGRSKGREGKRESIRNREEEQLE